MRVVLASNFPRDEKLGSARTPLRLEPELRRLGVDLVTLFAEELPAAPRGRAAELSAPFRMAWALEKHAERADLVDVSGGDGFAYFRYARARRPRQALVAHSNGLWDLAIAAEDPRRQSPVRRRMSALYQRQVVCRWEQSSIRSSDVSVFLSRADADEVVRRGWKEAAGVTAIHPGVDEFFLHGAGLETRRDVAFVGSFLHRKGKDIVRQVMSELLLERPGLGLTLFGVGMPAEALLAEFDERVRSRIHVEVSLTPRELAERLASFAVLLFPTRYEGFGIVVSEAMARGLAVVTTRTGAGADLIRDGENGLIVPVGAPRETKSAVARLLDDAPFRVRVATAAITQVSNLTWAHAAEELVSVYGRAVAARSAGRTRRGPASRST
jgi:glycosyltransferase involved in cell wall biosynthesis